jgi:site-specific DNA-cytosine methylase
MKRVLIACECSGAVRDAFTAKGFYAVSCDIKDTEAPGLHHKGDVFEIINEGWDLMIAHPPCTHLAVSGAAHFAKKIADGRQQAALDFVQKLMDANIPKIAIENPVSVISSKIRKPDQIIHPYQFGHKTTKGTCLWLKGLPLLKPTNIVEKGEWKEWICEKTGKKKRQTLWFYETSCLPQSQRGTARSRTFQGIADAMADQWGAVL